MSDEKPAVAGSQPDIADHLVSSALEFAVSVAAAGQRLKPALAVPGELKPFLRFQKLPPKAIAEVRRIVEANGSFRRAIAAAATMELLDEPGFLWLTRPPGWHQRLIELATVDTSVDLPAALRRSERRREAAEQLAARSVAEIAALRAEVERLGAELAASVKAVGDLGRLRAIADADLIDARTEARHAGDRLTAAVERSERARADAADAQRRTVQAEQVRDEVLAQRTARMAAGHSADIVLAGAAQLAGDLDEQIVAVRALQQALARISASMATLEPVVQSVGRAASVAGSRTGGERTAVAARRPVALPGGVYGTSSAASEHLVRVPGAMVLLDGYNVAKLGWPRLDLEDQRERCIEAAEDVARRYGTNIAVVFDGALVPGAKAPGRRLVRVQFSAEGVEADDVLRAEVAALPAAVPVVVVTNDQAVAADVRGHGANTMSSEQWLELARR
jgi:predicted RNA-binding protein with PIN domain